MNFKDNLFRFLSLIRKLCYRKDIVEHNYGFYEAIFHPIDIDCWCRYADVVSEVKKWAGHKKFSLLDCGAGMGGISNYLNPLNFTIFLLDTFLWVGKENLRHIKNAQPIIGDVCNQPLRDNLIDIIVSVGTVEHIPKQKRPMFFDELKRICRKGLILHFPLESMDGLFRAKDYDVRFQKIHKKIFGFEDASTIEHISSIHPQRRQIKKAFPDSKIIGRKNCDIWLKYMMFERIPLVRFMTGFLYYFLWGKKDNKPPFYECLVIWKKDCHTSSKQG